MIPTSRPTTVRAPRSRRRASRGPWLALVATFSVVSGAQARAPRLTAQLGHASDVTSAAFSPDGRHIVTGDANGKVLRWDVDSGLSLGRMEEAGCPLHGLAYSPDGEVLVGQCDYDYDDRGAVVLWDTTTGRSIHQHVASEGAFPNVAFSGGEGELLIGWRGGGVDLLRTEDGLRLWSIEDPGNAIVALRTLPGGQSARAATENGEIWSIDLASGDSRLSNALSASTVPSEALSADGRLVVHVRADGTLILQDLLSGEVKPLVYLENEWALSVVTFAPDGRTVLISTSDDGETLWDTRTGECVVVVERPGGRILDAVFAPDGSSFLMVSSGGVPSLWDSGTGALVQRFEGRARDVQWLDVASDGDLILTDGESDEISIWSFDTGREIQRLRGFATDREFIQATFSPDTRAVLAPSDTWTATIVDVETGRRRGAFGRRLPLPPPPSAGAVAEPFAPELLYAVCSPSGRHVITVADADFWTDEQFLSVWDVRTGQEVVRVATNLWSSVKAISISPDESVLAIGGGGTGAGGVVWIWSTARHEIVGSIHGHSGGITDLGFSPDSRIIYTASMDGTIRSWERATGTEIWRFDGHSGIPSSLATSPDGRIVASGWRDGIVRILSARSGDEIHQLVGHDGPIRRCVFTPDSRILLTASTDGTVRIWDTLTGEERCALISFLDGGWAVVDPDGRYDSSELGDAEGLHWVVGDQPIPVRQFKERFYEPGLLAKIMRGETLRPVSGLDAVAVPPLAEVIAPAQGSTRLGIQLSNQGGGIGRIQVFVNGKEVTADARGAGVGRHAKRATIPFDVGSAASLIPGETNEVRVVPWNAEGYLSGRGAVVSFVAPGMADTGEPEIWAVVGGVSDYEGDDIDLRYAARDAAAFATALEVGARRLFGTEKVHLSLLADTDDPRALPPTSENFHTAFDAARNARPRDVLVVYLAGHGISLPADDASYAYLTVEARSAEPAALADPVVRKRTAITSDDLLGWFKQIPALKQVLVLDTCAAGAAATKLVEKRAMSTDQIRAIERLRSRTGFHVLMGCASDRVSYEASQFGQGLLTYALLEGMKGAALREDTYVDVSRLFQYAADRVPQLSRGIGGIQSPLIAAPQGTSFDVGQLTIEDRYMVPLPAAKLLLLRPRALDPDQGFDRLGLEPSLRRALLTETGERSQGQVVFVDADEMPRAIQPVVLYRGEEGHLTVTVNLIQDGSKVTSFKMTSGTDGGDQVVSTLVPLIIDAVASQGSTRAQPPTEVLR